MGCLLTEFLKQFTEIKEILISDLVDQFGGLYLELGCRENICWMTFYTRKKMCQKEKEGAKNCRLVIYLLLF